VWWWYTFVFFGPFSSFSLVWYFWHWLIWSNVLTSPPIGVHSIAMRLCVCLSVCLYVCLHISETTCRNFTKFSVHVVCGYGSDLLWWQCDTLCTSGFVDDIMFARNGPYGAWRLGRIFKVTHQGTARRVKSWCLWLPCLVIWCVSNIRDDVYVADAAHCAARVVRWLDHLDAMCSRAWRALCSAGSRFDSSRGPGKARPPT